jgi:hypothetical protein
MNISEFHLVVMVMYALSSFATNFSMAKGTV